LFRILLKVNKYNSPMNLSKISLIRLFSQQLSHLRYSTPKEIATWMGAIQAQDFPMAMWAVGTRLPGSTEALLLDAIDKGDLLRTHLLRPTWHFVSPADVFWMLELTAPQVKAGQRSRDKQLELTEAVYSRSNHVIELALQTHHQLGRQDLVAELNRAGIATDQNRAAHLLMRAELEKIICSGTIQSGKPSYALLAERVAEPVILSKEEALAVLARRYFTSRGPATLRDFTWWSGLPAREAADAVDMVKSSLISEVADGQTYWLPPDISIPQLGQPSVLLLANYDEYILSYADRSASIPVALEREMKAISDRGVFWPVVVINGRVSGTWRRAFKKDTVLVEIRPFSWFDPPTALLVEQAARDYASFLGRNLDFKLLDPAP
jgi:hypothetical protein